MSGAIPIRRATVADADACARIVSAWVADTDWMPVRFSEAELAEMIADVIPKRTVYVAGDPVAGYLSFHPKTSLIAGLYVEERGRGLGKALVDRAKSNRDVVQLWTHAPNEAAHRFYLREGFVKTGETREGDDGLLEYQLEWRR